MNNQEIYTKGLKKLTKSKSPLGDYDILLKEDKIIFIKLLNIDAGAATFSAFAGGLAGLAIRKGVIARASKIRSKWINKEGKVISDEYKKYTTYVVPIGEAQERLKISDYQLRLKEGRTTHFFHVTDDGPADTLEQLKQYLDLEDMGSIFDKEEKRSQNMFLILIGVLIAIALLSIFIGKVFFGL